MVPQRCARLHLLDTDISLESDGLQLQESLSGLYSVLEHEHANALQRASQSIGHDGANVGLRVLLRQIQMEPEDRLYFYYQSVKHSFDVRMLCPDAPEHELLRDGSVDPCEAIDAAHDVSHCFCATNGSVERISEMLMLPLT